MIIDCTMQDIDSNIQAEYTDCMKLPFKKALKVAGAGFAMILIPGPVIIPLVIYLIYRLRKKRKQKAQAN
jgi:hypothetical protein